MTPEEHRVHDRAARIHQARAPQDPDLAIFYPALHQTPPEHMNAVLAEARLQLAQEDQATRIIRTTVHEHTDRMKAYTDSRIRAALLEAGQDPDVWEDIARRHAAGEFDPPPPTITLED